MAGAHICKCPACGQEQNIHVFPAYFRNHGKGVIPEKIIIDSDACCFNHPDKVAGHICDKCGIYLCGLCNIELEGEHFCPKCFKTAKEKASTFIGKTVLYDEIFLSLSLIFILTCYLGIIASPFMIGASIYFWNKMRTPYKRGKWRFVVTIIISTLTLVGMAFLISMIAVSLIK
jgi:hypothetical protein